MIREKRIRSLFPMILGLTLVGLGACDDSSTAPEEQAQVTVRFSTGSAGGARGSVGPATVAGKQSLTVAGTNGVLTLDRVHLIVDELELEGAEGACEVPDDDDCEDFDFGLGFVDLPLDGDPVTVDTGPVPLGTYHELEFEVEDLDLDDDGEDDGEDDGGDDGAGDDEDADVRALADHIRGEWPDWPDEASARIAGTFAPEGGDPVEFRAYFEAEVEIEIDLDPPLVIDDEGANRTITVGVHPDRWFERADGTVWDLSEHDFDETGEVLELEAEMEDGAWEVELDD